MATQQNIASFKKPTRFTTVAFSPDGTILAVGTGAEAGDAGIGNNKIILWNTTTREYISDIPLEDTSVFSLAFSPDGTILASSLGNVTIKLWDVETGISLATF